MTNIRYGDYITCVGMIISLLKVGMVQEESPAEKAGLRTRDFLWKVCNPSHNSKQGPPIKNVP